MNERKVIEDVLAARSAASQRSAEIRMAEAKISKAHVLEVFRRFMPVSRRIR